MMPTLMKLLVIRIVASSFSTLSVKLIIRRADLSSCLLRVFKSLVVREKKASSEADIKAEQINNISITIIPVITPDEGV
jgi:hypothetical protein